MLGDISGVENFYIAPGCTDMRKAIDGLAYIVKQRMKLDPESNSLFLFCGKRRDRVKALHFEGDGYVLLYKRLENKGENYVWPNTAEAVRNITVQQFRWLMEGLSIDQKKAHKKAKGTVVI